VLPAHVIPTYLRLRACDDEDALLWLATDLAPAACGFERAALICVVGGRTTILGQGPAGQSGSEELRQALRAAAAAAPAGRPDGLPGAPSALGLGHHVVAGPAAGGEVPVRVLADRRTGEITGADRDAVAAFATLVGLALERAILRRRTADLAHEVRRFAGVASALSADALESPVALPTDHGLGAVFPRTAASVAQAERLTELSPRERRVAVLLVDGRSNKEIAEALAVSPETVKTHVARIRRKLGAGNRVEVVALLLRATGEGG
jgi:DNA-binding CsgD family transcriptional regulator